MSPDFLWAIVSAAFFAIVGVVGVLFNEETKKRRRLENEKRVGEIKKESETYINTHDIKSRLDDFNKRQRERNIPGKRSH